MFVESVTSAQLVNGDVDMTALSGRQLREMTTAAYLAPQSGPQLTDGATLQDVLAHGIRSEHSRILDRQRRGTR